MSLALIQGYSSPEEEELSSFSFSSDEDGGGEDQRASPSAAAASRESQYARRNSASSDLLNSASNSSLPSAFAAFSEVVGPPEFLKSCVVDGDKKDGEKDNGRRLRGHAKREKRELPPGAVIESKSQLVGIHDRVRTDIEASAPATATATANVEGKRVFSASNPDAKDSADLLRMCLQCGIPKTYSHARGVVCPVCGDRPVANAEESEKRKGATIKDKEKSKRMRGQSSHATWKSETEMHLRQQYD